MNTTYTVKLRTDAFGKAALLAGFGSDYRTAAAMGVNRSTVSRVLSGEIQPGAAFIGGALIALKPMAFEDLFEVVPNADRTSE
ncbi:transcriptional regulator [Actinosynnema sp. NPDC023587]|uniref:transcriptional regulator n=1 Tax=Actinosynnema sp. NPDC023587 TaxID=3154695 RepID=UPI0033CDCD6C